MLNHHARRLARRLFTLFVLVAALAALSSSPVERKAAATTSNQQTASVSSTSRSCSYETDEWGQCVMICCDRFKCVRSLCWVRK